VVLAQVSSEPVSPVRYRMVFSVVESSTASSGLFVEPADMQLRGMTLKPGVPAFGDGWKRHRGLGEAGAADGRNSSWKTPPTKRNARACLCSSYRTRRVIARARQSGLRA